MIFGGWLDRLQYKKPRHLFIQKFYFKVDLQRLNKITKSIKRINLKTN